MNDKTAQRFGEVFRRFFETGYMDDLAELFQGESKVIVYLSTAEGIVYPSDISRDLMISPSASNVSAQCNGEKRLC